MEKEFERNSSVLSDINICVRSSEINFFKMNKGESITLPRGEMRLCAAVSGKFHLNFMQNRGHRHEFIGTDGAYMFFSKEQKIICGENNSELFVAEFGLGSYSDRRIFEADFDGINAKFRNYNRDLFRMFLSAARGLENGSAMLNQWIALIVVMMRDSYLRSYKNTLETNNGAIFFGLAPAFKESFELSVTDAFLVITDNESGEKKTVKFSCEFRFLEREEYTNCETRCFQTNKSLKYAHLCVPSEHFFKLWLFPENQNEKLNVSPFTHSLKFSFSLKANAPCKINTGISNFADYEMVCRETEIKEADKWTDFLFTFYGAEMPEKASRYIKDAVRYIDENLRSKITVPHLAKMVHLHPNYLSRVFKEYMGCSISQYVNNKRIAEAKILLKQTDLKVDAIATAVGFYDSHHLQKYFKQSLGYAPSEYRKRLLIGEDYGL